MASNLHPSALEAFKKMKTKKDRLLLGLMVVPVAEGLNFEERKKLPLDVKAPMEVIIDEGAVLEMSATHDDFIALVKEKYSHEARFFVVDFFKKSFNHRKLVLCAWTPDTLTVETKMIYCSSRGIVKGGFELVPEVQASDTDELSETIFSAKAK